MRKFSIILLSLAGCGVVWGQDSLNIQRLSQLHYPSYATSVVVRDSLACVGTLAGLHLLDVSDPSAPVEISQCATPGAAEDIALGGSYAYVANYDHGLRVVDIADPYHPAEVGFCETPGNADNLALSGNYVLMADADGGLRVISIADPAAPVEVDTFATPGIARNVTVNGNYAYVTSWDGGYWPGGMQILDITNPAQLFEVGRDSLGSAEGVAVNGNYAYVAVRGLGLKVVDISNLSAPVEVGVHDTPGTAIEVVISAGHAFLADGGGGLRIFDISDPVSPLETGFYDTPGFAADVDVSNHLVFVADEPDFEIYDCSAALGVHDSFIPRPSSFSLSAYPNPFNARTQIRFDLQRASFVNLKVYDVTGRLVETLASRVFNAGTHSVAFDGSERASGMYVVKLNSGGFSQAQRMVLIK